MVQHLLGICTMSPLQSDIPSVSLILTGHKELPDYFTVLQMPSQLDCEEALRFASCSTFHTTISQSCTHFIGAMSNKPCDAISRLKIKQRRGELQVQIVAKLQLSLVACGYKQTLCTEATCLFNEAKMAFNGRSREICLDLCCYCHGIISCPLKLHFIDF